MTEEEKGIIRTIIGALHVPRDRLGRLDGAHALAEGERMRKLIQKSNLPHGGYDRIDQAVMLLQCLVGDPPKSILDK